MINFLLLWAQETLYLVLARVIGIPVICLSSGTTIVDCYFHYSFLLRDNLFSYMEYSDQKTYFVKVDRSAQTPRSKRLSRTQSAICGPPSSHVGFCRLYGVAGGERMPPAPLGWYFYNSRKRRIWTTKGRVLGNMK